MENPYGAVPMALRETRLSLRDIMADMLMTKKMEQDLSLAKSKAETETALLGANIERDRLQNLKDIAQINEASRHNAAVEQTNADTLAEHAKQNRWTRETQFPEEMKFKREDLASQDLARRASAAASYASAAHSNAATVALNEERRRRNEVVSAGDYAGRFGAGHILPVFGIDPGEKRPAWQWDQMGNTVKSFMTQHPSAAIISSGYRIKSELEGLATQYNTPGLDAKTREALKVKIGRGLNRLNFVDEMIMSTKEPDTTKVAESARRTWAENPQIQTQFAKYDDFLSAFSQELQQTRSHFRKDMNSIKLGLITADIDPNFTATMDDAQRTISSLASKDQTKLINNGRKRRMEEGDIRGAYKYTVDWANYLKTKQPQKGKAETRSIAEIYSSLGI